MFYYMNLISNGMGAKGPNKLDVRGRDLRSGGDLGDGGYGFPEGGCKVKKRFEVEKVV